MNQNTWGSEFLEASEPSVWGGQIPGVSDLTWPPKVDRIDNRAEDPPNPAQDAFNFMLWVYLELR